VQIFAVYRAEDAKLMRLWADTWAANGWKVRLILPKHPKRKKAKVVSVRLINFGLRPGSGVTFRPRKWGAPGWKVAKLVRFPEGCTEEHVYQCGRPLVK